MQWTRVASGKIEKRIVAPSECKLVFSQLNGLFKQRMYKMHQGTSLMLQIFVFFVVVFLIFPLSSVEMM